MDFKSKVVVNVGGLGTIGYETSKQLIKKDIACLVILDAIENPSAVDALASMNPKCKVRYIKFDITDKASIQHALRSTVDETSYIDILINGAGILQESELERTLQVNLIGLMNTTIEALPYMDKRKNGRGGHIINIASIAGIEPLSADVIYSTSKFGVVGFTRCMAHPHYYNTTGVAVTAICPGLTDSPLKDNCLSDSTFDYGMTLMEQSRLVKSQTAAACAEHIIQIIETNKNNSLWISACGNLSEIDFQVYWTPKFK